MRRRAPRSSAHGPIGALAIAAEPEQIVGDAALDYALRAFDAGCCERRPPEADVRRQFAFADSTQTSRVRPSGALSATARPGSMLIAKPPGMT